jgi:amino acid transporter
VISLEDYKKNSLNLIGAVSLGTGVMISAGIFALLGQIAELSSQYFPFMFIFGSIIASLSAYSYIKFSHCYPSAGGIGMYLTKTYGKGVIASVAALMMILSMVINQSLVARTFGTYTMQLFGGASNEWIIPTLGVGLLLFSLIINLSGNAFIQGFSSVMSIIKIIGLLILSFGALYATKFVFSLSETTAQAPDVGPVHYLAAIALSVLAFKGFTTITNHGEEISKPRENVGKAIIISIAISLIIYLLTAFAVSSNLSISEIIIARDYALAEASRPVLQGAGLWFTVVLAIIATITAIIASVFSVSRLIAMLADMKMIPHKDFKENIRTQKQTLFYTVGIAIILTILFDLSRIASLGIILYLIMDMVIHYGLLTKMKNKVKFSVPIVISAFVLDAIVLIAFIYVKMKSDWLVVLVSFVIIGLLLLMQSLFMKNKEKNA